jgi:hypothetical protein
LLYFGVEAMSNYATTVVEIQRLIEEKRKEVPYLDFLRALVNSNHARENSTASQQAEKKAITRGLVARRKLTEAEGGSYSSEEVAKLLGYKHRQSVDYQREVKNLVAWRSANKWRYPVWQFTKDGVLPGIKECLHALNAEENWDAMIFFLAKRHSTGGTSPLDLLKNGKTEQAIAAALRDRGHGAQ